MSEVPSPRLRLLRESYGDPVGVEEARSRHWGRLVADAEHRERVTLVAWEGERLAAVAPLPLAESLPGLLAGTAGRVPLSAARAKLGDLVRRATAPSDPVAHVLTRHGVAVAVLLDAARLQPRHPDAAAESAPAPRRLAALGDTLGDVTAPTLPYGLADLDSATGGLLAGKLSLVAAAPGAGGSLLAVNVARHAALRLGRPVLYAASGLTRADVAARIVSAESGADYRRLRSGSLTPPEHTAVEAATASLTRAPVHIDDGAELTPGAVAETAPWIEGLALVVVDRLQCAPDEALPLSGAALPSAARALSRLARDLAVPVLAVVDSDAPETVASLDADTTLLLTRTEEDARLRVEERDFGTRARVTLRPDTAHARFLDAAAPAPVPAPAPAPAPARGPSPAHGRTRPAGTGVDGRIARTVAQVLDEHGGDADEAAAALVRRAIPDAMELLDACRIGGRYDVVGHPPLPGILRKKSAHGADEIWEARPRWTRPQLPPGRHEVTALDINGAYLSALKTHLPLGALEHSEGNVHSTRRAGLHLITPPDWEHGDHLPDPLGNREEPGPVWVTEPTLRLLKRLSTGKYGALCDPPVILESYTSGATENLLEKFRQVLRDARDGAIEEDDETTLEYVKAMYSKFVSTMGESHFNRDLYRPDWMHIIRSQAFVNLWLKAHRAHQAGVPVVRAMGTDELHVAGEWRPVFTEGRGVSEVKVKDVYAAGNPGE